MTCETGRTGPTGDRVPAPIPVRGTVRRLAVFRALMLGDLVCATPALRALRRHHPAAEIVFIGLPWAAEWATRQPTLDRFIAFPGHPDLPETRADPAAWAGFARQVRDAGFDLIVQMHGSGRVTNRLLACLADVPLAGFWHPSAASCRPDIACPWPLHGTEVERLLHLTDALGAARQGLELDWPVREQDHERAQALVGDGPPYACLHPGAQWASRRWPPERFAAVGRALLAQGLRLVVTGVASERPLADALLDALGHPPGCVDLVGRTSLWTAGAVVAGARVLVSNDTGLSHVAAALRTPSVVVACGSDVARWAPREAARHQVLWQDLPCRPCARPVCDQGHGCATALSPDRVAAAALALL